MSLHQALLFRQLSDDVTYFSHRQPVDADEAEQLTARRIRVVEGDVAELEITRDRIRGVRLVDGTVVAIDALVVASRLVARAGFLADLGLVAVPHPAGVGEHLRADPTGRAEVPGVWLAGNVTDVVAQVGGSAAAGAMAGAQINADLVAEETRQAVEARRAVATGARQRFADGA
jgi:thioredoxin reductase